MFWDGSLRQKARGRNFGLAGLTEDLKRFPSWTSSPSCASAVVLVAVCPLSPPPRNGSVHIVCGADHELVKITEGVPTLLELNPREGCL